MTVPTLHFTKNLLIHSSKFSNSIQMKFEPDSNSLLKTYSKPIKKFWNFAITFVLHQYLTTKNIINPKNAQSHLAFDQTPSICTVHICKKNSEISEKFAAAPLLLLSFCSSMRRGRRRPWSRGGREQGALGRKSGARSGPWERGGRSWRRWAQLRPPGFGRARDWCWSSKSSKVRR